MEEFKLSYNAGLKRVKVSLTPEICAKDRKPPKSLFKRARDKLEDEKRKGIIETYEIFEDNFYELWAELHDKTNINPDKLIEFTLAQGAREHPGISLQQDKDGDLVLTIDIDHEKFRKITWNSFYFNVRLLIKKHGFKIEPHEGMLRGAYMKARYRRHNHKFLIKAQPTMRERTMKGMSLAFNKALAEAYIYIFDDRLLRDEANIREVIRRAKSGFSMLAKQHAHMIFLGDELRLALREMATGSEFVGVGLPRAILFALKDFRKAERHELSSAHLDASAQHEVQAVGQGGSGSRKRPPAPKGGLFDLHIDDDGMEARIETVNYAILKNKSFKLSKDTLIKELKKHGIEFGFDGFIDPLLKSLTMEADCKDMIVARGRAAVAGADFYLHPLYLDHEVSREEAIMGQIYEEQKTVSPGRILAEIRSRDGVVGKDVFGQESSSLNEEVDFQVEVGKGVEQNEEGKFVATIEGMPMIGEASISMSPVLVHKGDVSRLTGDINFKGSIEVHGNIENGAKVIAAGDLVVYGSIARARIKCGGRLICKGGINTTMNGRLEADVDVFAEFIENSRVAAAQNIRVRGSILNSYIIAGQDLEITDRTQGTIAGGVVIVGNVLFAGKMGYSDGKQTICRVGSDWTNERRTSIIEARIQNLQAAANRETKEIEEIKNKERTSDEQKKLIKEKQKYVSRIGLIVRKNERRLAATTKNLNWNRDARLMVESTLTKNVDINVGGRPVPISADMRSILITYHKFRDHRINPLELLNDYLEQQEAEEQAS